MIYNIICYMSPVPGIGVSEPYDLEAERASSGEKRDSVGTASMSDAKGGETNTRGGG